MAEVTTAPPRAERPPAGARFQHLIDGRLVGSADGREFETIDPHTGQVYGTAAEAGAEDVRRAVAAARRAFDEGPWPRMNTKERRALLNRLADRVHEEAERLAVAGDCSAGLRTTVFPNARAGEIFQDASMSGKFHGEIAATTPTGSYRVYV